MAPSGDLSPCPHCGYFQAAGTCGRCGGEVLDAPDGTPIRPGRRLAVVEIAQAFALFFRAALQVATRREYFGKLVVPMAANLAAFALLVALALWIVHPAMARLAAAPWCGAVLRPLPGSFGPDLQAAILTATAIVLLGPSLLQTLTIPFLAPLTDAVEQALGGPGMAAVRRVSWRSVTANVRSSAQVVAMQILALVPCLLLSFCHLGLLLALVIAAFLNALLWFEIPFDRRGYTIDQRIRIVRHNWGRALGYGLAFQLAIAVPFLNVLLLAPAAATAISMLYFHLEKVPPQSAVRPLQAP